MSATDERTDYRDLPPVEPVEIPERLSQTFLARADRCPRSAYLGVKHRNAPGSDRMDGGTALHLFAARGMGLLIEQGEQKLPPELAKVMMDEVLSERSDLVLPAHEADAMRVCAYHWSVGLDVDPQTVLAVEQKFVLDVEGWTVSGIVDLAALDGGLLTVDDTKSSFHMPSQAEFEESFQTKLYSLMVLFGRPVERFGCACYGADGCPECGGRGYTEVVGECLGDGIQAVRRRETYPRYLRDDGRMQFREETLTRTEVADFRTDVERMVRQAAERFETWKWPARSGPQCSQCPAEHECPIPREFRDYAGAINSEEQAAEAMEWALRAKARAAATEKEVKNFQKPRGPLVVGEQVFEWVTTESWVTDWDGLEPGLERAANFGEPFELSMFRKRRSSTSFKPRKLTEEERRERR